MFIVGRCRRDHTTVSLTSLLASFKTVPEIAIKFEAIFENSAPKAGLYSKLNPKRPLNTTVISPGP